MWQQNSYQSGHETGLLYLVPTPIGNLEDMTFRAIRILKEADYIGAEDTRQTKKLCNYFEIQTPLFSYHEHNKEVSGMKLIDLLKEGKTVALVSDAGTPAISDPGYELVVSALEEKIPVVPLPGANAALSSLIASGLNTKDFYFYGFLPRGKKEKKEQLERLKSFPFTMIFYESPHRLKETLSIMHDILGERSVSMARELTKKYEEFIRGPLSTVVDWTKETEIRGEFCLVVEGSSDAPEEKAESQWWDPLTLVEHVQHYIDKEQLKSKEAVKKAAADRNLPKREVYQAYHVENES
ncbi:16S rRNA (cytidine(1402)-2'-O)-methyltransferase [Fictibacillus sp. WQ 8-8]|uniref:16S rRNA (cytidine(1402)-2'-O)-methyltransferase n=1 Tax=unclassified Fictibacillus TaxID=2644029 RepID=UPI0008EC4396|nr:MULTISPECIES: 16S rRNA (cytidine(1402)-2'-O)-methyltransferase [unclassified Fictibacillus]MCQ6268489.1 16S rRNA (cytidine(1402)-2'-O)-methyltransferase [Fictibacillus sp. WQ 8-8]MED2971610.1 16S rRNA (cytidine(1402)-2'-O)-methyltransferase [Fictibacillus sp. B-59209]SFF13808.1 16S rRNA (cytidine1402-2'-O)-methyltransferase [Bacillus sp. OV194]